MTRKEYQLILRLAIIAIGVVVMWEISEGIFEASPNRYLATILFTFFVALIVFAPTPRSGLAQISKVQRRRIAYGHTLYGAPHRYRSAGMEQPAKEPEVLQPTHIQSSRSDPAMQHPAKIEGLSTGLEIQEAQVIEQRKASEVAKQQAIKQHGANDIRENSPRRRYYLQIQPTDSPNDYILRISDSPATRGHAPSGATEQCSAKDIREREPVPQERRLEGEMTQVETPPLEQAEEQPGDTDTMAPSEAIGGTVMKEQPADILVVEDETAVRDIIKEMLEFDKHIVHCAGTGEAALEMLSERDFDLILLDLRIPVNVDGVGVYRWIIAHKPELERQIILLTGSAESAESSELIAKRGCAVVKKPFLMNDFLQVVKKKLAETAC